MHNLAVGGEAVFSQNDFVLVALRKVFVGKNDGVENYYLGRDGHVATCFKHNNVSDSNIYGHYSCRKSCSLSLGNKGQS